MDGGKEKDDKYLRSRRTPGELIKARRKELGWVQDDLEWRSGVSKTQISRIERDMVSPELDTITKLEEALGISLLKEFAEFEKTAQKKDGGKTRIRKALCDFELEIEGMDLSDEEVRSILGKALFMAGYIEKNKK